MDVGLSEGGAHLASERIVAGERLVGAFNDDDGLLAFQGVDDGGQGEGADDVDVDGTDFGAAGFAEVVHGGLDIFGGGAQGNERHVGVIVAVFRDRSVVATGEFAEVVPGVLQHAEDGLGEIVPAGDNAVHIVLLILDGAD